MTKDIIGLRLSPDIVKKFSSKLPLFPRSSLHYTAGDPASTPPVDNAASRSTRDVETLKQELHGLSVPSITTGTLIETSNNTNQIHHIGQGEWGGVIDTDHRYLATAGASLCFVVSIYDIANRRGVLSHLDASTNTALTINMMHSFVNYPPPSKEPKYRFFMTGGSNDASSDMATALGIAKEWQGKDKDIEFVIGQIFHGTLQSVALDLETGELLTFVADPKSENTDGVVNRFDLNLFQRLAKQQATGTKAAAIGFFPRR